ncbi:ComEA family DNA-binding protein [Marinagarivorans cellulosilyticus]|uniref:Competence protein ComEA n=1 Tax=Marinagarivorans cellulosilyticus TaxID=2721545 RepID=A0AAN1WEH6_9GAMM|nr:helix-hairpin-helix domain-containing protein [Marinagarivorans cellulosilyticus]BCD96095.1 competence protein ComEA [Marinagarivorans cellulosilyticus]
MTIKTLSHCVASILLTSGILSTTAYAASTAKSTATETTSNQTANRVSINSANAAVLAEHLIGIGPSKAEAIVAWRSKNGRFSNIEQLLEVKGIGAATLNKNKHLITL